MSGVVSPFSGTQSTPARPVKTPETRKATYRYRRTWTPTNSARTSLSRIAWSAFPNGECTITHMTAVAMTKTART